MVGVFVKWQVLQDRTQPDCAGAEFLQVRQRLPNAGELATLESEEAGIIEWRVTRRRVRVVEAVHHKKVDPVVPPIHRRWERPCRSLLQDILDFRTEEGTWHWN